MKRYERFADEIAGLIRQQTLRPGDKLPSVRQASAGRQISPSTVFQAYYLLEARGLIRARPRSGYYVNATARVTSPEPLASQPPVSSTHVAISDLVFEVLGAMRQRELVPLGSAFPGPELFPLPRLARTLASGMRRLDPRRIVEDLGPGNAELRRQIALRYAVQGMKVDPNEIVITNGAMEALNLCLQAVTEPGDVVAIESPTFYAALQALERLKLRAVEVTTHPRHGVDLAALRAVLARHRVKACWFMPNFQNPLGSLMPDEVKRELVALLGEHDIPLIEDDVYGELYFGRQPPLPAKAFDRSGSVMHCGSFSKCLAPGYRVGWVAAGRQAQAVERLKLMSSLSAPVPSQQAISGYLQQGGYDRHLRQLRQALAGSQARALRAVERHFPKGTRITRPEGGYFLWVELPASVDALQLQRLALAHSISLAPGQIFSADRRFGHCLRLNFGHAADKRLDNAIRTVGQLAGSLMPPA
ncbi:MAG TPA: PLP-dependent aminotransferase family protein [Ideonella sp.]|uniref:aminotransferase-like domain-containing protein n=1 Tax=Ideonella sp. TaxID=1929293 RepID=UPI002E330935|nr:PLP-dependent aminotransferase family protein [Ideonella sp.]HEX5688187.1 PLP-dependent aminotransferase family protein [Ideonella sp.]